jgi:hypothetical protein
MLDYMIKEQYSINLGLTRLVKQLPAHQPNIPFLGEQWLTGEVPETAGIGP